MIDKAQGRIDSERIENAYTPLPNSYDVEGLVLESEGKNIRVKLEDGKIVDVVLKKELENVELNTEIKIPRELIRRTRIDREAEVDKITSEEEQMFESILKSQNIEANEENIKIAKLLDDSKLKITKDNVLDLKIAIESFEKIKNNIDYDVVEAMEKENIEVMEIPIIKLSKEVERIKSEIDQGKDIEKIAKGKKEISWDEARSIAKKVYGAEMGKDILDIIKVLKREDVEITRNKIDEIHDVFSKLENIKKVEKDVFAEAIKRKMEVSIDTIYSLKNYVVKSKVESVETPNGDEKIYINNSFNKIQAKKVQVNLPALFKELGIEENRDSKNAAMALISRGEEITKEKIFELVKTQEDAVKVIKKLDYKKASDLMEDKVEIARIKLAVLKEKLEVKKEIASEMPITEKEITEESPKIEKEVAQKEVVKEIPSLKKEAEVKKIVEAVMKEVEKEVTKEVEKKVEEVTDKVMAKEVSKNNDKSVDKKADNVIDNMLEKEVEKIVTEELEKEIPKEIVKIEKEVLEKNVEKTEEEVKKIVEVVMKNIEPELKKEVEKKVEKELDKVMANEIEKSADKPLQREEMSVEETKYKKIDTLVEEVVEKIVSKEKEIPNDIVKKEMEVKKKAENLMNEVIEELGTEIKKENDNPKIELKEKFEAIKNIVKSMDSEKETIFATILKSGRQFSLGEMKRISDFMENKKGVGQVITKFIKECIETKEESIVKLGIEAREILKNIPPKIHLGRDSIKSELVEVTEIIKEIKKKSEHKIEKAEKITSMVEATIKENFVEQKKLNQENIIVFQVPFFSNGEGGNAQVFIERKAGKKKIDPDNMKLEINIKTESISNINFKIKVEDKKFNLDFETSDEKLYQKLEYGKSNLIKKLEKLGYIQDTEAKKMTEYGVGFNSNMDIKI